MTPFDELTHLLTIAAGQSGDGVEVQDRRSIGIVGISIYSLTPGKSPTLATEWMHDLDGLTVAEALAETRSRYRTDLIVRLLASECPLEFVSLREACDLMPTVEETDLHAPMLAWLAGELDLDKLARTLPAELQGLFMAKNGHLRGRGLDAPESALM